MYTTRVKISVYRNLIIAYPSSNNVHIQSRGRIVYTDTVNKALSSHVINYVNTVDGNGFYNRMSVQRLIQK